jgi:diguanylate cyclase (GGDEF)-like protein
VAECFQSPLKEIPLYADKVVSIEPKTIPAVQGRFNEVLETAVDEETPEVCMAMKSADSDSHVSRAEEIEAFAQFKASSPLLDMPEDTAESERDAVTCGPNDSVCDAFQISPLTERYRLRAGPTTPALLNAAGSLSVAVSPVLSSIPSMIAGPAASQERRPTILVVDDEPLYLKLIADILGDDFRILVADEGMTGMQIAATNVPQLILLDLMMPVIDGFEVYRCLKADTRTREIPVIFITGVGDVVTEAKGLRMGAVDYINKPIHPDLVKARVNTQINLKLMRDKLLMLAVTDGLTGLANRFHFDGMLAYEYARHLRSGEELALIMLDIDQFKAFNDTYGHISGDECLREVAKAMTKTVSRSTDLVARYGGEEFVVLLPDTSLRGAVIIAETIRNCISEIALPQKDTRAGHVTVSLGVVSGRFLRGTSIVDLLTNADIQLYRAKAGGRNRVAFRALEKSAPTH